jgi:hypothetical protein
MDITNATVRAVMSDWVTWIVNNYTNLDAIDYEEPGMWSINSNCDDVIPSTWYVKTASWGGSLHACVSWSPEVKSRVFSEYGYTPTLANITPASSSYLNSTTRIYYPTADEKLRIYTQRYHMQRVMAEYYNDFYTSIRNNITRYYPEFRISTTIQKWNYPIPNSNNPYNWYYSQNGGSVNSSYNLGLNWDMITTEIAFANNPPATWCSSGIKNVRDYFPSGLTTNLLSIYQKGSGFNNYVLDDIKAAGMANGCNGNSAIPNDYPQMVYRSLFYKYIVPQSAPSTYYGKVHTFLQNNEPLLPYSSRLTRSNITNWGNNKTNNQDLHIYLNGSEGIRFNASGTNITTWHWLAGGVDLNNNFSYLDRVWEPESTTDYIVEVYGTKSGFTASNKTTFTITVNGTDMSGSNEYIPPSPINNDCQSAIYSGFCTWEPGIGNNTNAYHININEEWTNYTIPTTSIEYVQSPHENLTVKVYSVNNSGIGTVNQTPLLFTINVSNYPPAITPISDVSINQNDCWGIDIESIDSDYTDLMVYDLVGNGSLSSAPVSPKLKDGFTAGFYENYYEYCPTSSDIGIQEIIVSIDDGYGGTDSDSFNITVLEAFSLQGMVYGINSEQFIQDAPVYLSFINHTYINKTTSNSYGYYNFTDALQDGDYYVYAWDSDSANHTNFSIPQTINSIDIYTHQSISDTVNNSIPIDYTASVGYSLVYSTDDVTYCLDFLLGIGNCIFPSVNDYEITFTATDENGFTGNQRVIFTAELAQAIRKMIIWIT